MLSKHLHESIQEEKGTICPGPQIFLLHSTFDTEKKKMLQHCSTIGSQIQMKKIIKGHILKLMRY